MAANIKLRWRHATEDIANAVYQWPLYGSGGSTPVALTHKRGRWVCYADQAPNCGDVFVWQYSRGAGGATPASTGVLYPQWVQAGLGRSMIPGSNPN